MPKFFLPVRNDWDNLKKALGSNFKNVSKKLNNKSPKKGKC